MSIYISNITNRTITIRPKSVICEIQPVTIEDPPDEPDTLVPEISVLDQVKITESDLTDNQLIEGRRIIESYEDIFAKDDQDIGNTAVKHRIDLIDDRPFKQRYRRIPPAMYEEVKSHLKQLLANGTIRPSHSPYASNVVLVRKKSGKLRLCVDYRQLNNITKKDSYALPRIEDLLDVLSGSTFFQHHRYEKRILPS